MLAQCESILKGADGFVFVGVFDKKGNLEGGIAGQNISHAKIAIALAKAFGMSPEQLGLYLMMVNEKGLNNNPKKKVVKKKVAKKAAKKVAKKKA